MKKPIAIIVIIHNDLQNHSRDKLYEEHFSWLKTELEDISRRYVFIHMPDNDDVNELAEFNYRNDDEVAAINDWKQKTQDLYDSMSKQKSFQSGLVKILLLTRYNINETLWGLLGGVAGITYQKSY